MFEKLKVRAVLAYLSGFFAAAPKAVRNHLNLDELARIVVTAVMGGATAYEVLGALARNIPAWVAPADVALATGIALTLVEVARRLGHGPEVPPPTAPPPDGPSAPSSAVWPD